MSDCENDNINLEDADEIIVYHINDTALNNCPHVDIVCGDVIVNCILDSGALGSIISERVYNDLVTSGVATMELGLQN
jgi:hypothetical protein